MIFHLRPGWTEPLNIYTLVALPSGARKSVVFEAATRPLTTYERLLARREAPMLEALADGDIQELAERVLRGHQQLRLVVDGGGEGASPGTMMSTPPRRNRGQAAPGLPPPVRLFVGDVTPERVGALLVENGGRIAILSDEGEVCEVLGGRHGGR